MQVVEDIVIVDMCVMFEVNNFEILLVFDQLFKSDYFYDVVMLGIIIKNLLEFIFFMLNFLFSVLNFDLLMNYQMYLAVYYFGQVLGMEYLCLLSVGGWMVYYQ